MKWLGLFLQVVLILVVSILPALVTIVAEGWFRENLNGFYWDDATGVIVSRSVKDSTFTQIKEYEGILNYTYIHQGHENTKTKIIRLEAVDIKYFNRKYYRGAKVKLKINPQNPSEVLFEVGYIRVFLVMIFAIIGSLAIFIFCVCYALPNLLRRFRRESSSTPLEDLFKELGIKNINPYSIYGNSGKSPQSNAEKDFWTAVPAPYLVISPYAIKDSELNITITTRVNQIAISSLVVIVGILSFFWHNPPFSICLSIVYVFVYFFEVYLPEIDVAQQRQFDKSSGYYWEGKKSFVEVDNIKESHLTKLSSIKALQILSYERTRRSHDLYQLNIVENDGTRTNVINCERLKTVLKLADKIAGFLNVQVLVDQKIDRDVLIKC